jgi:N-acetylmuramoyl-L-alanine amidase
VPIHHVVKAGESVVSLAEKHGLFAPTIWDAPENAALKALRPDMNTLMPGDELFIPDLRRKAETVATDQRHKFRRKGVPARFRIQLYDFGEPRANQDFTLVIDKMTTIEGTSDGDGVVEATLPPGAQTGRLTIGEDEFVVELAFGQLDPLSEISGVQQRLTNLGYDCGVADGEINSRTQAALRAFQLAQDEHLLVTGELDDATRERIGELHDAVADDTFGKADDAAGG